MARIIQDRDLQLWEAYATAGDHGFPRHARLIFHCLTDPTRRARGVTREGTRAVVEKEAATLPESTLVDLLATADELT